MAERTVNDLILYAYRLISVRNEHERPSGAEVVDGLYLLNTLLDQFSSAGIYIAYRQEINVPLKAGQEKYTIGKKPTADFIYDPLVDLEIAAILQNELYIPLKITNAAGLYRYVRTTNIQTRPYWIYFQRQVGESVLTLRPIPDYPYVLRLFGKFAYDLLQLNSPITQVPLAMQRFLQYALARELNGMYGSSNWTQQKEDEYQRLYNDFTASNDLDMTVQLTSALQGSRQRGFYNIFSGQ